MKPIKPLSQSNIRTREILALTNLQSRYELGERNQEEVEVEEELELFIEDDWEKCESIVLLIPNDISWVSRL